MKRYIKELANDFMNKYPEIEPTITKALRLYERCYISELEVIRMIVKEIERGVQDESSYVSR